MQFISLMIKIYKFLAKLGKYGLFKRKKKIMAAQIRIEEW